MTNEPVKSREEKYASVSNFIVDEQIISNWKIDNKVVYIELSSLETKYSSLLGAKIRYIVKHFRELGFKVDINRLPKEIKDIILLSFKRNCNTKIIPRIKNVR